MTPCFAIIERNTLARMALKSILLDIYYGVDVLTYGDMDSYIKDSNRHFLHFFVDSDILFSEVDEFETLKHQTTVVSPGPSANIEQAGYRLLDISLPEDSIISQLSHLQNTGKYENRSTADKNPGDIVHRLSPREKDVLRLIVKGYLNKEVADELNISLATAIFHRNNICEKLNTRSVGKMTVMAVLGGLVDINEI